LNYWVDDYDKDSDDVMSERPKATQPPEWA